MKDKKRRSKGVGIAVLAFVVAMVVFLLLYDTEHNVIPYIDLGTSEFVHTVLTIAVFVTFIGFALRLIGTLIDIAIAPRAKSYASVRSVWKIFSYMVWAAVLVILLIYLVGDMASSILSIGMMGAALTFALQKPLTNIAGWITISFNRMYRIGDRVAIGDVRGYVTDIKVMNTVMYEIGEWMDGDTFTGRITNVPNGMVFDKSVHNYTKDYPLIWDEITNLVTYESDIDRVKAHMLEAAGEVVEQFMTSQLQKYRSKLELHDLDGHIPVKPELRMELSDSGVKVSIIYWSPAESRRKIRSQIVEKIWRRFSEDPLVEIAYPHLELVKKRSQE